MLRRSQLVSHKAWLDQIHASKSKRTVQKVVEQSGLIQLKLLVKLIYDVALDKISLTTKKYVTKLFKYKSEIRSITGNVKNLLKQEESLLRSLILPLVPILKIIVSPLFEKPADLIDSDLPSKEVL